MTNLQIRQALEAGEWVTYRPVGNSIRSGYLVTIAPVGPNALITNGDVVFCKVGRYYYLHLVTACKPNMVQISNNHGHVNGWTSRKNIFGRLMGVAP